MKRLQFCWSVFFSCIPVLTAGYLLHIYFNAESVKMIIGIITGALCFNVYGYTRKGFYK